MDFIDTLSFCLSLLGIHGLILYFRSLLPLYVIPPVSELLDETMQLLDCAEEIGAVPPQSEFRTHLDLSANRYAVMCVEGNHAQGSFQQLRLALLGRTCILYSLYYHIEAIKSKLELTMTVGVTGTVVPGLVAVTATPMSSVIKQTLLPSAITS